MVLEVGKVSVYETNKKQEMLNNKDFVSKN